MPKTAWRGYRGSALESIDSIPISAAIHNTSTAFRQTKTSPSIYVLSDPWKSCIIGIEEEITNARLGHLERHVERDLRPGRAPGGEDSASDDRVCLSGCIPEGFRQARTGAAQPLRPGGAAVALQHRAERHH